MTYKHGYVRSRNTNKLLLDGSYKPTVQKHASMRSDDHPSFHYARQWSTKQAGKPLLLNLNVGSDRIRIASNDACE